MYSDSITSLTMQLMRLGRTRLEAERITASIVTGLVVVLIMMGYRIRFSPDEKIPEPGIPSDITGIHTGRKESDYRDRINKLVNARNASPAIFSYA